MGDTRWLKRLRRELAPSGRRRQLAWLLAAQDGDTRENWNQRLLAITSGESRPDPDAILRLEAMLARPKTPPATPAQDLLAI